MKNSLLNIILVIIIFICNISIAFIGNVAKYPTTSLILYSSSLLLSYYLVFKILDKKKINKSFLTSSLFIVLTGICLRILFINYQLSNDVNRYAFEGMIQNKDVNPYIVPPEQLKDQYLNDPIYKGINHKNISAAYPPIAMLTFKYISKNSYSLSAYKYFFVLCDCIIILLLIQLLKYWKKPRFYLLLYSWNPIVLIYGAGEGHIDIYHMLYIVISLLLFEINKKSNNRKIKKISAISAFASLGLAVMTKYLSIIIFLFSITKKNIKYASFFFIPFLTFIFFAEKNIFQGLFTFSSKMAYNDFFPKIIRFIFDRNLIYFYSLIVVSFSGILIIWLLHQQNKIRGLLFAYLWLIFSLPCVHIWYLMPFVILLLKENVKSIYLFLVSIGTGFYVFAYELKYGIWKEFNIIWLLTYIPVLIYLYIETIKKSSIKIFPNENNLLKEIDIVIPVLNDNDALNRSLKSLIKAIQNLKNKYFIYNIIVVEGGDKKNSLQTTEKYNAKYINTNINGRGYQISLGIKEGKGDLVLILHSDTIIRNNKLNKFNEILKNNHNIGWGILGHHYDKRTLKMRLIEILNFIRFNFLGIAFSDQGIFVKKDILNKEGNFPEVPLMEDIELSLKLFLFHLKLLLS